VVCEITAEIRFHFFQSIAAFCCSQYVLITRLLSFPSSIAQWVFYQEIYSGGGMGDCMSLLMGLFFTWLLSSILCRSSKSVTPYSPSFGDKVLCYLQEDLNNVESESECAFGSDHNTEYAEAEGHNQKICLLQVLLKQTF
jgi:hypothetical protein